VVVGWASRRMANYEAAVDSKDDSMQFKASP
jgi:hypothetical protein